MNLEPIFASQCSDEGRVFVTRYDDGIAIMVVSAGTFFGMTTNFGMVREDAEAMARAILGIPNMCAFDWDRTRAEIIAEIAHADMEAARDRKIAV